MLQSDPKNVKALYRRGTAQLERSEWNLAIKVCWHVKYFVGEFVFVHFISASFDILDLHQPCNRVQQDFEQVRVLDASNKDAADGIQKAQQLIKQQNDKVGDIYA